MAAAGAVYLASTYLSTRPMASVAILIAGRALLGVMESFVITGLQPILPVSKAPTAFGDVVRAVWIPGLALALSGFGFAAVTTFVPLLLASHGWGHAWLGLTAFSVAFMVVRMALGHLPDRVGGMKVASFCMLIEAVGLTLIWRASGALAALVGVTIAGVGYSLVYPGLGVEAIRLAPRRAGAPRWVHSRRSSILRWASPVRSLACSLP
jgi:MFS family permease